MPKGSCTQLPFAYLIGKTQSEKQGNGRLALFCWSLFDNDRRNKGVDVAIGDHKTSADSLIAKNQSMNIRVTESAIRRDLIDLKSQGLVSLKLPEKGFIAIVSWNDKIKGLAAIC